MRESRESKAVIAIVDGDLSVRERVSSLLAMLEGIKPQSQTLGRPSLFAPARALFCVFSD